MYRGSFKNIRIEEVELSENDEYWLITLGYDIPSALRMSKFQEALGPPPRFDRDYKLLKIDANTGEIISMKIRKL
ncbi:MAG: hypothetical protein KAW19_03935 [Candidatus Aminicenantes bacterium]|nr:hypothetical protein [Candidatus Aminicenantes bacterium]